MIKKKITSVHERGLPLPIGVTVLEHGINFTLFSRHATAVSLVIQDYDKKGLRTREEIALDPKINRTGDIWHIFLHTMKRGFCYGYRIDGEHNIQGKGMAYNRDIILIDPLCQNLLSRKWGEAYPQTNIPICRLHDLDFDWQNDRPLKIPISETIIYELHVRGFTRDKSSKVAHPGTYRGLTEKIPYLQKLGITAVELLPVTEWDETDNFFFDPDTGERLKNYWGYNPISFCALKSGLAHDNEHHIKEFKTMVRSLHKAGIEVIMDMVYNHTGEGDYNGRTTSFRGIDNTIYYHLARKHNYEYMNYSGCGNTFNCNHPVVRELIRESLRYWVMEMHVDGFRFDLASILGRDSDGHALKNPPMIEMIAQDPILRDTKIIAEAWDAAGLYQVGSFSRDNRWAEWNGKFRDDIRSFMAGHSNTVANLATRFAGSADLYETSDRSPGNSINFITSHDGFTLYDLVSYEQKHNLSNGEENRDGDNHNLSWNSGTEGQSGNQKIISMRNRRIRSFTVLLILSQGVPMITAGDEFCRTQNGNNNAWCQDNPSNWIDWDLAARNKGLIRFFKKCIKLRKSYSHFRRNTFFSTSGPEEISWQALKPGTQDWSADCHILGIHIKGHAESDDFFLMFNGQHESGSTFTLPAPSGGKKGWTRIINTACCSPLDFPPPGRRTSHKEGDSVEVKAMAAVVLQSFLDNTT